MRCAANRVVFVISRIGKYSVIVKFSMLIFYVLKRRCKVLVRSFVSTASVAILVGCSNAQKASEVSSIRIPIAPYLAMDCTELATEQNRLSREAELLRNRVDDAYASDKNTEIVTWLLFAPAAFFLDGNSEEAAELGAVKGQIEAVREAQQANKCSR